MKLSKWTWVRVLALSATIAFIWCLTNDRLSPQNWSVPVDYSEDCHMVLGWIQAGADGDFVPFLDKTVHRLGAPYAANWNDWPVWGEELIYFYGVLTRWMGLFQAANLAILLGYVTTGLGFYAVCRLMKYRREWSFVGAVLFAFTYFHAYRHLHHLLHTYSYSVPFAILSCWLIAFSRGMQWRDWRPWVCLGTAAAMSITNPYNLNLFGQLVCLGLFIQFVTQRRKLNLQVGVASLALIVIGFFAIHLHTFSYAWAHGNNPDCLTRGYYETELFALKPMELIVPPLSHHVEAFRNLASQYMRQAWLKGEPFSPYLGFAAIGALAWMLIEALKRLFQPAAAGGRFPSYIPLVLWVFVYSVVGGLNCVIALATEPLFRGSNRYSIFISALALLFLVSRLSWWSRRWTPGMRYGIAGVILLVGLYDQLPEFTPHAQTLLIDRVVQSDRQFSSRMEQKLPPKAMVFQLPVVPYPESTPVNGVQAYDPMRPWFFTKTLHFSYGANKGRPQEDWMKDVEKLPGAQMASTLEKYGFAALYLDRKGFPDQGAGLLQQLTEAGRNEVIEDDLHERVCVFLKPSATPQLPPAGTRVLYKPVGGWVGSINAANGTQSWANGEAGLILYNGHKNCATQMELKSVIGSMESRRLSIEVNGKEIWNDMLAPNAGVPLSLRFDTQPGKNVLRFKPDAYQSPSRANPVPHDYALVNLRITRVGEPAN
jgi:hypothetical protein